DSSHLIRTCRDMNIPSEALLVTCDVESLYLNIGHEDGIAAVLYFLDLIPDSDRMHDSLIVDLLDFILKHNYFVFDRTFFLQVSGVAMGARCAPALANLFLGWWEATVVYPMALFKTHVRYRLRYIDDLFLCGTGTSMECQEFIEALNHNAHNIILTQTMSPSSVTFLDLQVTMENGSLLTSLFSKPMATNSLLEYRSFHPVHTKRGVPIGQFLRVRRNCTEDNVFHMEARELTSRLKERNYPRRCILAAYERARSQNQVSLLTAKTKVVNSKPALSLLSILIGHM
ncbi:unnamed protein product, partial [Ranitomeya imitator]